MTVDNLLYATGAAYDLFGALLIFQGFQNISDEDIMGFSKNQINSFSEARAKSLIQQRYEAMFGGGFIIFGSFLMLVASILGFQVPTEKYPNIVINQKIDDDFGVLSVFITALLYYVSYKFIIKYLSKKKLTKILSSH